jgi:hypothetical protein
VAAMLGNSQAFGGENASSLSYRKSAGEQPEFLKKAWKHWKNRQSGEFF